MLRSSFRTRARMLIEILALRHQLAVLQRQKKRVRRRSRAFAAPSAIDSKCVKAVPKVVVVKPETVIAWHRKKFRLYWRWKSKAGKCGRPCVSRETRGLIRQMSKDILKVVAPAPAPTFQINARDKMVVPTKLKAGHVQIQCPKRCFTDHQFSALHTNVAHRARRRRHGRPDRPGRDDVRGADESRRARVVHSNQRRGTRVRGRRSRGSRARRNRTSRPQHRRIFTKSL
jgi:hypothetical protein